MMLLLLLLTVLLEQRRNGQQSLPRLDELTGMITSTSGRGPSRGRFSRTKKQKVVS
jgi:hypothetical protein